MSDDYDLDRAYEIHRPEEALGHYGSWAATYDDEFGAGWGYIAPREIARLYLAEMRPENQPLLDIDIGAGTGLVAEHLGDITVDAIDITPEMLAKAEAKGLYRRRVLGDLTKPLEFADAGYGEVISCGTFTHGHVGPECFPELLRITRPGALFCCGTIAPVLDGAGFGSALARLVATGKTEPVRFREIPIYDNDDHHHGADRGLVMVFRKT